MEVSKIQRQLSQLTDGQFPMDCSDLIGTSVLPQVRIQEQNPLFSDLVPLLIQEPDWLRLFIFTET